jgi:hypothetical protein
LRRSRSYHTCGLCTSKLISRQSLPHPSGPSCPRGTREGTRKVLYGNCPVRQLTRSQSRPFLAVRRRNRAWQRDALQVFDVQALSAHAKAFSESLGLLEPPKVCRRLSVPSRTRPVPAARDVPTKAISAPGACWWEPLFLAPRMHAPYTIVQISRKPATSTLACTMSDEHHQCLTGVAGTHAHMFVSTRVPLSHAILRWL